MIAREAATGRSDAKRSSPRLRPAPRSVKSWLPGATGSGGPSPAPYPPTEGTTSTCLLQSCPRDPEEAPPLELAGGTQPSSHRPRRSSRVVPQGRRLWTWFAAIGCLEALDRRDRLHQPRRQSSKAVHLSQPERGMQFCCALHPSQRSRPPESRSRIVHLSHGSVSREQVRSPPLHLEPVFGAG